MTIEELLEKIKATAVQMRNKCYEGTGVEKMRSRALSIEADSDQALTEAREVEASEKQARGVAFRWQQIAQERLEQADALRTRIGELEKIEDEQAFQLGTIKDTLKSYQRGVTLHIEFIKETGKTIESLRTQLAAHRWIPVAEGLPENKKENVLWYNLNRGHPAIDHGNIQVGSCEEYGGPDWLFTHYRYIILPKGE